MVLGAYDSILGLDFCMAIDLHLDFATEVLKWDGLQVAILANQKRKAMQVLHKVSQEHPSPL